MERTEIIKEIFTNEKIAKNANENKQFTRQLANADIEDYELDVDYDGLIILRRGKWIKGEWLNGKWRDGTWENGTWWDGDWMLGDWEDGTWKGGLWWSGDWESGTWEGGRWKWGSWHDGTWEKGTWKHGEIYNPKTERYEYSEKNPNECEWSLSYRKAK